MSGAVADGIAGPMPMPTQGYKCGGKLSLNGIEITGTRIEGLHSSRINPNIGLHRGVRARPPPLSHTSTKRCPSVQTMSS